MSELDTVLLSIWAHIIPYRDFLLAAIIMFTFRGWLATWWADTVFIYRRRLRLLEKKLTFSHLTNQGDNPMDYSDKVMEHFQNPRNVGEIPDADGVGEVGNPTCGDMMKITIKVAADKIVDCKFKTLGCGAAIATSSITTEMAKGLTLADAEKITREQVAQALDGLPPEKMHCSNLAADGLHAAVKDYRMRKAQ